MPEEQSNGAGLPPASESIHLPGPTYLPVLVAAFTTIALVGIVVNPVMFGIGIVVVLICIVRWIRDVRRDIADLPLEH